MDRETTKMLMKELGVAATEIARKHGMEVKINGATFGSTFMKPRIEFLAKDEKGRSKEEREWDMFAESLGLDKNLLGKQFNGKTIIGLDMKKRKYPVILMSLRGNRYKTSVSSVKNGWYSNIG